MNTIKFTAVACSDKGKIRGNNEDNFYFNGVHLTEKNRDERNFFEEKPEGHDLFYGVFDGMGGEALGEEASLIAAKTVKKYHNKINKQQANNEDGTILRAVDEANNGICNKMLETGEKRIGTTFALLSIKNDRAKVYNVGDSRVYLFRDKKLRQVSVDDTTAQRLVNMGVITNKEAETHEDRHKLTQHLGIFKDEMVVEPHVSTPIDIKKGDRFLLCSDGLTDMVTDDVICAIMQKTKNSGDAAKKLVEEALNNGGIDNVTVTVVTAETSSTLAGNSNSRNKLIIPAIALAVVIIAGICALAMCNRKPQEAPKEKVVTATGLKWANQIDELSVGDVGTLMVQTEPSGVTGEIVWSSSDINVITINDKGFYTAVAPGEATITAQLDGIALSLDVRVVVPIESITIENKSILLDVGGSEAIMITIMPETSTQTVSFVAEDPTVVSVDGSGVVTALKGGKTKINVLAGEFFETVEVEVKEEAQPTAKPTAKPEKKKSETKKKETTVKPTVKPAVKPAATPAPVVTPAPATLKPEVSIQPQNPSQPVTPTNNGNNDGGQ